MRNTIQHASLSPASPTRPDAHAGRSMSRLAVPLSVLACGAAVAASNPVPPPTPTPAPQAQAVNRAGAFSHSPAGNAETPLPPALDAPKPAAHDGPVVQLALLLDTSNSMDGLIDQARAELWTVVNELRGLQHERGDVQLQIALYQYGNDALEAANGFVQLRVPFTTDLDILSEQLFALRTNGGSEYCGRVIGEATDALNWIDPTNDGDAPPALKLIVIAGNEPFSQGTTPYSSTIPTATNRGVRVHTVFCGDADTGRSTFWAEGAELGEGFYFAIDQSAVVTFETEFDERIIRLNSTLNSTYVPYGRQAEIAFSRQSSVDTLNFADSEQAVQRVAAKASTFYRNSSWDLLDAVETGEVDLSEVDAELLPEALRDKTAEELAAHVEQLRAERDRVAAEITELVRQREDALAEERKARGIVTLGTALAKAIIDQSRELGFTHADDCKPQQDDKVDADAAPAEEPATEPDAAPGGAGNG